MSEKPVTNDTQRAFNYRDLWSLEGQAVVVLGAGNGIGYATSQAFADLGAQLVLVDLDPERANTVARDVGGVAYAADVRERDGVLGAIETAVSNFGRVDGGVDIVGGATRATVDDITPEMWDAQFALNVRHAYLLGNLLGPRLAKQRSGSLTFLASTSAWRGSHVSPAYSAAKSALVSWVRSLSTTYAPYGVRSNAVSPGVTLTPRVEEIIGEGLPEWLSKVALKQANRPQDIAAAIAFLASPAARTISGTNLLVDGGTLARDPYTGDRLDSTNAADLQ